jgi:hypothetical protein
MSEDSTFFEASESIHEGLNTIMPLLVVLGEAAELGGPFPLPIDAGRANIILCQVGGGVDAPQEVLPLRFLEGFRFSIRFVLL